MHQSLNQFRPSNSGDCCLNKLHERDGWMDRWMHGDGDGDDDADVVPNRGRGNACMSVVFVVR